MNNAKRSLYDDVESGLMSANERFFVMNVSES